MKEAFKKDFGSVDEFLSSVLFGSWVGYIWHTTEGLGHSITVGSVVFFLLVINCRLLTK